jgi:hypothetical protein
MKNKIAFWISCLTTLVSISGAMQWGEGWTVAAVNGVMMSFFAWRLAYEDLPNALDQT